MTTICTPIGGNKKFAERWILDASPYLSSGMKFSLSCRSSSDAELIKNFDDSPSIFPKSFGPLEEKNRIDYVGEIYESIIRKSDSEFVVLWDYDISPPKDSISQLIEDLESSEDSVAGIATVYPFKDQPEWFPIFFNERGNPCGKDSIPESGLHQIWGGGRGFSIWRRDSIVPTLRWSSEIVRGAPMGIDWDLAAKLKANGWKTILDSSIVSKHGY